MTLLKKQFNHKNILRSSVLFLAATIFLSGCSQQPPINSGKPRIVATTSIVGDVVGVIGGDMIDLTTLLPIDTDPHAFEPVPQDATRLAEADLIFQNGLGLEDFLTDILSDANAQGVLVTVSDGIQTKEFEGEEFSSDPHVWTNPQNVKVWADNIAAALAAFDPSNANVYRANAENYKKQLDELDLWAMDQIAQIPASQRVLVTDHESFGYFAQHYGLEIIGALIPSYSTQSEPSAGELAELESAIRQYDVRAIFVGISLNPALAERVAADTGINLVPLYTETLSNPGGPAATYLEMIRFDVVAITAALK